MDDISDRDRRTTDERARVILESVTDAFFSLDRDFRFAYLNGTAERLLQRSDLIGKNLWEEFPRAHGTEFQRAYERAMWQGERVDFVEHYPAPLDRWYQVRAYPSPEGVSVYFQDITDRRIAEDAYQRNREQMELVVRGANVGVWYCPLPFDELIWDDKVKEHFHLPPDARVSIETFYERLHPEDRERTREAIATSIEARTHYDIDYRTVSPDGSTTKWIRAVGRAFYGADGTPTRFDGVTSDVSERMLAEIAVREREERYRLATRATNDVVWDWDLRTDEIHWNEALATRYGHVIAEAASAHFWEEHIHPEDRERVVRGIGEAIATAGREHWEDEYRFAHADGSYADVLDRGFVFRDGQGGAVRMIGAMHDLTERKRAERDRERIIEAERAARSEAERQSHMKDEFLATLSHELRTPLNAILGWSQLTLARADLDPSITKALEVVVRNARTQSRIIDDLLDMSRMLSGKVSLDVVPLAIGPLVEASFETVRPTAEAKGVQLLLEPNVADAVQVVGDASRLQQMMWNLLSNAVKFTNRGGRVVVSATTEGESVTIRVRDEGAGIAPDFLPFVFDRFRQADGSITRQHGGLGLGLSIVKRVAELHGGTVTASSDGLGKGATFEVALPRAVAASDGAEAGPPSHRHLARIAKADVRGLRVLVVDDETDARSLVTRLLEDRGATVESAGSAAQAMTLFTASPFDVLVSDIGMPGEDGYGLLQRIRALGRERGGDVPAIAVTAYARASDRLRALSAGYVTHLAKPVDALELVAIVAAAAGRLEA